MSTTDSLRRELATLKAACKVHRDLIVEAQWQRTLAMEFAGVPVKFGCYVLAKKDEWKYPSVQEASRQVEILGENDGYYWACSRITDIELLLGSGKGDQLPLRTASENVPLFGGSMPPTHPPLRHWLPHGRYRVKEL
jgi:hypothetical protein